MPADQPWPPPDSLPQACGVTPVIVAPRSLREDDYESKVNLGYIVRAY